MNKLPRITFILALAFVFAFATVAIAEDVKLDKKIERVTLKKDKNGQPFAILVIQDTKTLDGISYTGDITVFAFGEQYGQVKNMKRGDRLTAICAKGSYNGQPNYRILQVVK